jgi:hypothetical protein
MSAMPLRVALDAIETKMSPDQMRTRRRRREAGKRLVRMESDDHHLLLA